MPKEEKTKSKLLAVQDIPEPKLTLKQRKFLDEYFKTGNGTQAALKAYDCKDYATASVVACDTLRKLKVSIKTYMEAKGFSLQHLVATLAGGLKATKIVTSPTEADKETPDWHARHKYLTTAAKWLGVAEEQNQPSQDNLKRRVVAEEFFND